MTLTARLLLIITALTASLAALPGESGTARAGEPAGRVLREQTVEGMLILKGATRKNRCLIAVKTGRNTLTMVADRDELARALRGEDGAHARTGDYVRVTFVRKLMRIEGMDISANFFRSGELLAGDSGGVPTNIGDAFRGRAEIRAYACRGALRDEQHDFDDVRRACGKRDATRHLTLQADGKGYYTPDNGARRVELTWYPDEFEDGVVNILSEGKLHAYAVYDGRYLEGAAGPEDSLPTALKLE